MCLAVPGRISSTAGDGLERLATVQFGSINREVSLAFTPEARVGDYVLVHVGFAINRIDEAEAERLLATIESLQLSEDAGNEIPG